MSENQIADQVACELRGNIELEELRSIRRTIRATLCDFMWRSGGLYLSMLNALAIGTRISFIRWMYCVEHRFLFINQNFLFYSRFVRFESHSSLFNCSCLTWTQFRKNTSRLRLGETEERTISLQYEKSLSFVLLLTHAWYAPIALERCISNVEQFYWCQRK